MDSIKVYGINIAAFIGTAMTLNEGLQTTVLVLTIAYTAIQIYQKLSKK